MYDFTFAKLLRWALSMIHIYLRKLSVFLHNETFIKQER